MVLELPTYKWPSLRNAVFTAKDQGISFLQTAGTVIMAICIVMWWLSAYPQVPPPEQATALRARAAEPSVSDTQRAAWNERSHALEVRASQRGSFAGRLGRLAQPVFAPLGFDSQLTVGILTSFLAREVFVSTMSVLVGGSAKADVDVGVIERIRSATRDDGTPLFTRGDVGQRAGVLRAGDAVPADADRDAPRDRIGPLRVAAVLVHVGAGLRGVADRVPGAARRRHTVMPDAATVNGFVQHAVVSVVALGALGVVLRRVLGVFERRPPASSAGIGAGRTRVQPLRRRKRGAEEAT